VPAVAVAVSSVSVSCSTVDQLKVYVSAIFENLARKLFANIASLPSNFQTAALKERLSMLAVAIAVSFVSSLLFSLLQA